MVQSPKGPLPYKLCFNNIVAYLFYFISGIVNISILNIKKILINSDVKIITEIIVTIVYCNKQTFIFYIVKLNSC